VLSLYNAGRQKGQPLREPDTAAVVPTESPSTSGLRRLGKTELTLSTIGFGASPLGNVFGPTDPDEAIAAVHFAIDQGINFFDVSPYYGLTVAETQLGRALHGWRDRVMLATKCGRYGADEFDFSAERIRRSIDESLVRLRTDHVDLLQAHDVEFGDPRQIVEETIPAMRLLQKAGKARYIGISGYSLPVLIEIAEQVPLDSILTYCHHNLMIADMEQTLLPVAKRYGIGLINASALHMGLLTANDPPAWHPAPAPVRAAAKQVMEFCRQHGVNGSEVALRFCFGFPEVASTLVGMATRQQVESSLSALKMREDPQLLAEISKIVAPVHNYVWPSGRNADTRS
jgi:L-galactose dehydrogenase